MGITPDRHMVLTEKQKYNFWQKVEMTSNCWNWSGYTSGGYGRVNIGAKVYLAHRVSYLVAFGEIEPLKKSKGAKGKIVMHTCDNRKCVNPSHLILTTQKENMRDAKLKGRKWVDELKGEKNPRAKLTESIVRRIRVLWAQKALAPVSQVANEYGVDRTQIYGIINNKSWKHVTL